MLRLPGGELMVWMVLGCVVLAAVLCVCGVRLGMWLIARVVADAVARGLNL
jgi:hypothetical protein